MTEALATRSLPELEQVIERGLSTFVEVGEALLEIRERRLYLDEAHDNFDDYCRERWGVSRFYAHRLIDGAEVSAMLPVGNTPSNERQARELTPLKDDPDQLAEAWAEASENGKPTAEKVREVVDRRTRGTLANQSGGRADWSTPQGLFDALDAEFDFDTDVCASDSTAKCSHYFTPEQDALAQEWRGTCFMNPPYGDEIARWVQKASDSATAGATVVCLVPARVDTGWWWDYCRFGEVRFLRGRLRFDDGGSAAPFPSVVVVFGRPASVTWWER